jgi:hypothetical protein
MSIDSPVADDLIDAPQHSAGPARVGIGLSPGILHGIPPLLFTAAVVTIGAGVVAAIMTDANPALAILVGYAALAATMALARGAAAPAQPETIKVEKAEPSVAETTAAAWKLVSTFTVSDASRLLCNVEPGAAATQDSIAWGRALIDAIRSGGLALPPGASDRERENPHYMTQVTREALNAWADGKGTAPAFLRH